jgi:hypothetical protein
MLLGADIKLLRAAISFVLTTEISVIWLSTDWKKPGYTFQIET